MDNAKKAALSRAQWWILGATAVALGILAVAAAISAAWIPTLPDRVAIHWGIADRPNNLASPGSFIAQMVGIMAAVVFLFAAIGFSGRKTGAVVRLAIWCELYIAGLGALILLLSLGMQRGLADAGEVQLPAWVLIVSLGAPVVVATAVALLVPRVPVPNATRGPSKNVRRAQLVHGEVPTWNGKTTMSVFGIWGTVALIAGVTVWVCAASHNWYLLIVGVPLMVVWPLVTIFTIQIGPEGLRLRAPLGWPKVSVKASQIVEAKPVEVRPFGDFGGWGYRVSLNGEIGVVLRKGPGVKVEYGDGQVLVFTVNGNAKKAASVINAAADAASR